MLSLWRWVSNQNTSLVILLHWRFQLLPCSLKPNVSFPHQCCITVSRFFLFFFFFKLIPFVCVGAELLDPQSRAFQIPSRTALKLKTFPCVLSVRNWVTPLGHARWKFQKSMFSCRCQAMFQKESLFRTIECMINVRITSLDISSTLSWLVRQGVFHLRAGQLNFKLKGPLSLTTNCL